VPAIVVGWVGVAPAPARAPEPGYVPPTAGEAPPPAETVASPGETVEGGQAAAAAPTGVSLRLRGEPLVTYGDSVKLKGRLESKKKGKKVKIERSKAGSHSDKPVASVRTEKHGRFSLKDKPKLSGKYRAVTKDGRSGPVLVEVKPLIELDVEKDSLKGEKIGIDGSLLPAVGHRQVVIEQSDRDGWSKVEKAKAGSDGFDASWTPKKPGEYRLRARFAGDKLNRGARQKDKANVYRESVASHYGSGFYGSRTACGQTLGKKTLGVANKKIPCGTKVTFFHKGREVKVPVIDRGPYVGGRDWDLTTATARKLKVNGVEKVWSTR
jgi:hypothetical protein